MKKLNIVKILDALKEYDYCIIKGDSDLLDYEFGSDVDIFSLTKDDMVSGLMKLVTMQISPDQKLYIEDNGDQVYVDVIEEDKINFRFDLWFALPVYKNTLIKSNYFSVVIANRVARKIDGQNIYYSSVVNDLVLRYIEYNEWFSERPDKIKHIKWIVSMVKGNPELEKEYLLTLHRYIELPRKDYSRKDISRIRKALETIKYIYKKIIFIYKRDGFIVLIKKIAKVMR